MSLVVFTGPVRSGKSHMAEELARTHGGPVTVVVAGRPSDEEMERRIALHKARRPAEWDVVELDAEAGARLVAQPTEMARVLPTPPAGGVLLVDCLSTLLGSMLVAAAGNVDPRAATVPDDSESAWFDAVDRVCDQLAAQAGDIIVVTNEVGWGVVPESPLGRVFADGLGRANRRLVALATSAWLVVAGRAVDLATLPDSVGWPGA